MKLTVEKFHQIIDKLGKEREVFTGETDFANALALEIKQQTNAIIIFEVKKQITVNYRTPINKPKNQDIYIDMLVIENGGKKIGIEIKYKTARLVDYQDNRLGYRFNLRDQSANDLGRHGFRMDIYRLQALMNKGEIDNGFCIFLTNESKYWELDINKGCMDGNYRMSSIIKGEDEGWIYNSVTYDKQEDGCYRNENKKLHWTHKPAYDWKTNLHKDYKALWTEYTAFENKGENVEFKYMLIDVEKGKE
jgi:hypothetical protein